MMAISPGIHSLFDNLGHMGMSQMSISNVLQIEQGRNPLLFPFGATALANYDTGVQISSVTLGAMPDTQLLHHHCFVVTCQRLWRMSTCRCYNDLAAVSYISARCYPSITSFSCVEPEFVEFTSVHVYAHVHLLQNQFLGP